MMHQPPAGWVVEAFEGEVPFYVDEVTELAFGQATNWWSKNLRTGAPVGLRPAAGPRRRNRRKRP